MTTTNEGPAPATVIDIDGEHLRAAATYFAARAAMVTGWMSCWMSPPSRLLVEAVRYEPADPEASWQGH
mgnify:CR=1 FL=1